VLTQLREHRTSRLDHFYTVPRDAQKDIDENRLIKLLSSLEEGLPSSLEIGSWLDEQESGKQF
jgi:hypothetical protein